MYAISVLVSIVVVGVLFWYAYLLLVRPKVWFEWFVAKPWKSWGATVSITDEQKFRKHMRWFGILMAVSGLVVAMIIFFGERYRF